jgi:hypothetical protein
LSKIILFDFGYRIRKVIMPVVDLANTVRKLDSAKYIVEAQFDTNRKGSSTDGAN